MIEHYCEFFNKKALMHPHEEDLELFGQAEDYLIFTFLMSDVLTVVHFPFT